MSQSKEVFVKTTNIQEKLETEKIRERINTQREKCRLIEKFKNVKSLVDSDQEEDASDWYQRTKRSTQKNEESPSKRFKSSEKNCNRSNKQYTSNNLKGLAIGHKVDAIQEGQQIVLTLRDKDVLNEDEDILENVNIVCDEKAAKNVENKKKKPDYKPYDDEEFEEFGIFQKPSLLSKYDEEIEGPKTEMFRIGSPNLQNNSTNKIQNYDSNNKISLNWSNLKIANEYYTPEEMVKFKKPSKKKSHLRKQRDQINNFHTHSIVEEHPEEETKLKKSRTESKKSGKNKIELDIEKIDDDLMGPDEDLSGYIIDDEAENELQSVLHKTRKIKLKEKFIDPALNIAKLVKREKQDEDSIDNLDSETNQIVLNATAEFCRNLGEFSPTFVSNQRNVKDVMDEIEMKIDDKIGNLGGCGNDSDLKFPNNWNEVNMKTEEYDDETSNDERLPVQSQPILEEEPDVSVGVAGALKLAMTKGYLDKETGKSFGATRTSSIIQAQSYTIEEKFYDDDRLGRRDRYSGPIQEFREKDNYKPDFKLDYVDEKGRMMNQKEAFRYLSHKFHGKGPGKNKIDKRMKKMEQESKLRQMSSTDTPLNTVKLLQDKQKELQTPYIVLSGQRTSNLNNVTQISKSK